MNHLNRINCRLWNFVSKLCCWFRRIWNYAFFWKNIWLNSPCPHPQITHHKMSLPLIEKSTEMSHVSNSTTREKKTPKLIIFSTFHYATLNLVQTKSAGRKMNPSGLPFFLSPSISWIEIKLPKKKKVSPRQEALPPQKTPLPRLTRFRDVSFTPQNGLFWARMCASGWAFFFGGGEIEQKKSELQNVSGIVARETVLDK